jgi:hypothetical protein
VILANGIYRGQLVWNRSRWVRDSVTRRRRRLLRDPSEHVVKARPDLRLVSEELWARVQARRAAVRALIPEPTQFGRARKEYGQYLLSGLLYCAECGTSLTIRSGRTLRGDQKYGCSRRWRRGTAACGNGLHVRRDLLERKILSLLQEKLYCREAVDDLVQRVNGRLQRGRPRLMAEQEQLLRERALVSTRLHGLRQFVEQGDTSASVREWLIVAERDEDRIRRRLAELESETQKNVPIRVHPDRVSTYLRDTLGVLSGILSGIPPRNPLETPPSRDHGVTLRARALPKEDVERIVIHPTRTETGKPFARAEVLTTGKGLPGRVAFVVAGAGFEPAIFALGAQRLKVRLFFNQHP